MDPESAALLELRRQRAVAQLDVVIDVLSAWRGYYDDDDAPASIDWIMAVVPRCSDDPPRGWLCVRGYAARPGVGWEVSGGRFWLKSLCGSLAGLPWPVARRQFREAARKSGVCLPARHATLHFDGGKKR